MWGAGSPWELRHKILIKGKRLKPAHAAAEESESSDDDDDPSALASVQGKPSAKAKPAPAKAKAKEKKVKIEDNWSTLVYLAAVHFKSFDLPGKVFEMSSYSEKKCKKMCGDEPSRQKFIVHNQRQVPSSTKSAEHEELKD